jgi:hypothetical protein
MKAKIILMFLLTIGASGLLHAQDQEKVQIQDRIHLEDHYRYYDGQLFQYRNGIQTRVTEQQRLNNGTVINPDGSYQLQNQERYQLRQGECLDNNGFLYRNHNKFNRGKSISNKKIVQRRAREVSRNKIPRSGTKPTPRRGRN